MNRTKNAIRNAGFGIFSKFINLAVMFGARTVFIYFLGTTYLGVNGLYTEVLSLLSIAELGFGSAMTFSMYKPVVENDNEKIIALLDFYKKIYRIIAFVIFALGIILVPFLRYIVKDAEWLTNTELQIYYLFYLANTVIGYFVTYKYTYLNALQKNYVQTNIDTIVTVCSGIAQIIVILLTRNFLLYLCANSFILITSRLCIIKYLHYKYPILKVKPSVALNTEEKNHIYYEVKGLAVHQFASAAVHSTDNLLISSIISVNIVGLISNYTMLMNSVLGFVTILFNSVTSGFGNLAASSTTKNFRKVFKEINFANFWIYGFCTIAFWVLVPPFIVLWIGADKLIDDAPFALILLNCYLQGQCTAYNNARNAKGNFNQDKWWAALQAIVNLVVSVIGAIKLGLLGIYIGTIASRFIYVFFRPYSTYKVFFGESCTVYYKKLFTYLFEVLIAAAITTIIAKKILITINVLHFIFSVFVVAIVPNCIFLLFNYKNEEFLMWVNRFTNIIKKGTE